jgi:cob(I)alamin adenosyltransferase
LPRIYTKKGDQGETGFADGARVPKDDPRIEAYGTVDELNAAIGSCRTKTPPKKLDRWLARIQNELFEIGADLSFPWGKEGKRIETEKTERLEREIDEIETELAPLAHFIVPGGTELSASLQMARTICRRAERRISPLLRRRACNPEIGVYVNRLSDWLFVMARYSNRQEGVSDIIWRGGAEDE